MTSRDTEIERIAAALNAYGAYTERGQLHMTADKLSAMLYDAGLRTTSQSDKQPASEPSLDVAWETAVAAIQQFGNFRLEVGHTPRGLDERRGKYRAWAVGLDAAWGDSPAAALQALAARLSQPTEPSETDQE